MSSYNIFGILLNHRSENAPELQKILTKYGCLIKVRLGLHDTNDESICSNEGLIILQVCGNDDEIVNFQEELKAFKDIKLGKMKIE